MPIILSKAYKKLTPFPLRQELWSRFQIALLELVPSGKDTDAITVISEYALAYEKALFGQTDVNILETPDQLIPFSSSAIILSARHMLS